MCISYNGEFYAILNESFISLGKSFKAVLICLTKGKENKRSWLKENGIDGIDILELISDIIFFWGD